LKRSEKTAIRKPAKWRGPTEGRLDLFIFFFLLSAEGRDGGDARHLGDESDVLEVSIKSPTVNKRNEIGEP